MSWLWLNSQIYELTTWAHKFELTSWAPDCELTWTHKFMSFWVCINLWAGKSSNERVYGVFLGIIVVFCIIVIKLWMVIEIQRSGGWTIEAVNRCKQLRRNGRFDFLRFSRFGIFRWPNLPAFTPWPAADTLISLKIAITRFSRRSESVWGCCVNSTLNVCISINQ
jgi:hypothetical protein